MPVQTRCPSCGAALASAAAWCSLCHADLRPRSEPAPTPALVESSTGACTTLVQERPSGGRHSRGADPVAPPTPAAAPAARRGGKHAAGRSRPAAAPEIVLEGLDLPEDGRPATPDEVDALAQQMLSALAATEKRPTLLDPEELPGGKIGFIVGAGVVLVLVVISVLTILGFVLTR